MKKHLQDSLVIGFALFSMFFGAGNVIFPPNLGLESGPEWLAGVFSYFMADIGLALLAMFAILRQGSPDGISARIGRIPSTALMCAIVLCIGRAIGEAMASIMVAGNVANMPGLFQSVRFLTTAVSSEMANASGLQRQALFSIALVLFLFIMLINIVLNTLLKRKKG